MGITNSSIGVLSWALLRELRWRFCCSIAERFDNNIKHVAEIVQPLLADSSKYWSTVYRDPEWFQEGLKRLDPARRTNSIQKLTTLLPYLAKVNRHLLATLRISETKQIKNKGTVRLLERLIQPYVMAFDVVTGIRWYYPGPEFIHLYYESDHPEFPLLYPYFKPKLFELLRESPGVGQQPLGWEKGALRRMAAGMRSLDNKLIYSFDRIESSSVFEDRLAGNGSAFQYRLQDSEGRPVGMVLFCSPIHGLFHHLLLGKQAGLAPGEPIFVCGKALKDALKEVGEAPGELRVDQPDVASGELGRATYLFQFTSAAFERPITIHACRGCRPLGQVGEGPTCPFEEIQMQRGQKINSYLNTCAHFFAEFNRLIEEQKKQASVEAMNQILQTISHAVVQPISGAIPDLEECRNNAREEDVAVFSKALSGVRRAFLASQCIELLARGDKRAREWREGKCDVFAILEDIKNDHYLSLEGVGIRIVCEGFVTDRAATLGKVDGTNAAWFQILWQLLRNAKDASTAHGSEIIVRVQRKQPTPHAAPSLWLTIENVPDQPLEPEIQEKIRQAIDPPQGIPTIPENPNKRDSQGLGLVTVRKILEYLALRLDFNYEANIVSLSIRRIPYHGA